MTVEAERLPVEQSEFTISDPGIAEAVSADMFGAFRPRQVPTEGFTFGGRRTTAGDMTLDHLVHSRMSIECAPLDYLMCTFVTGGTLTFATGDTEARLGIGDTAVCPVGVPMTISWDRLSKEVISVPEKAVQDAAAEYGMEEGLRFVGMTPVSSAMDRFWRSTVGYVAGQLESSDSPLREPLVYAQTLNLLATAAVKTFPNNTMTADYRPGPGEVSTAVLRRAVEFIEANAHRPLVLADIAAAVSVSPRALRHGFVRQYGTSPLGYLHRVRLERARRDLQTADPPAGPAVGSVAAGWGFPDPERFSDAYQRQYGQLPGPTLRT
ncbi:AraC family transcriptional regulator [Streptomyces sp. HNM0575]|uniref:AraC family transcriptional regulator n=1 Tax=Streptomyces sp. HNM0575 TaxID=2716338 RepID=UPI00145D5F11|nr:AraC family transcriptional regulator [Streptomyces sp. HNM0575]NLU75962.1 AraC family transcriptional regulator [Streptomyces sp. HNM0575]